jgi:hypothetical protein
MRIGIVGGLDRAETELSRLAHQAGHEVEFHDGHLRGPSAGALESMIGRSDVVVIITEVNSHAAVLRAKDILRRAGRQAMFLRKVSKSRLRQLLDEVTAGMKGPALGHC